MKKLVSILMAAVLLLCAVPVLAEGQTYTVGVCQLVTHDALEAATGVPTVVMDANDFDQNQLGKGTHFPLTDDQIQDAMADNPSGQGDELTPFILIRPLRD